MATNRRGNGHGTGRQGHSGQRINDQTQAQAQEAREGTPSERLPRRPDRLLFADERGAIADVYIQDCKLVLDILKAIKALYFPGISILRMSLYFTPDSEAFIPGDLQVDAIVFPPNDKLYLKIEVCFLNLH